jgi:hypothetical protein
VSDYCEHCQRFDEQHQHQHFVNTKQAEEITRLKARNEKLAKAAKSLKNNVSGMLGIERDELKQIFGNTNVSCLELSLEMVTKALEDCDEAARSGDE